MVATRATQGARIIAFAVPCALLAGAYISQYGFGLVPCEMCWWQRYAHFAALVPAFLGLLKPFHRLSHWLTALAALAIAVSAGIGLMHAGVEYKWWEGLTRCSSAVIAAGDDPLAAIMSAPIVRCDEVQWRLFGISMAGWNFLISSAAALTITWLLLRSRKSA